MMVVAGVLEISYILTSNAGYKPQQMLASLSFNFQVDNFFDRYLPHRQLLLLYFH